MKGNSGMPLGFVAPGLADGLSVSSAMAVVGGVAF